MNNKTKKLGIIILSLLLLNIATIIYMQSEIEKLFGTDNNPTAYATGTTAVCVNDAPTDIGNGSCNFSIPWGYNYNCTINATDPDIGATFSYQSVFLTNNTLFKVTNNGAINVNPSKTDVGNHTIRMIVDDGSTCSNSVYFRDATIEVILANHAPILSKIMPNISVRKDNVYTLFLGSYLTDPDDDNLTYTQVLLNGSSSSLTIDNSSFTTTTGLDCGIDYMFFIAEDPSGLTNTSNTVSVTVYGCPIPPSGDTGTGGGGEGSGGLYNDCIPEWICGRWSECYINNTQNLVCRDQNGCNIRDYIRTFERNCTYIPINYTCDEDWECGEWSVCKKEVHTRECRDKNSCGTLNEKPQEKESCVPIISCFNGIKDGNETSVDCGGECGACKIIETPGEVTTELNTSLLIAAAMTIATITLIAYALRKQIAKAILSAWNLKRNKKNIYLTEAQKQKLLNQYYIIQQRFGEQKYAEALSLLMTLMNAYFKELISMERLNNETLKKQIPHLKNASLEKILYNFYFKVVSYINYNERHMNTMNIIELQSVLDEILNNIYLVSEFSDKDALVCTKERVSELSTTIEECYLMLSNVYIALEFTEVTEAKNLYRKILKKYDTLNTEEKKKIYPDIMQAYDEINYIIQQNTI
jgi:hypothetical protein